MPAAPDAVKPFLLDFAWSSEKLRALPLEAVELPLAPLAACLQAPLWPREGRPFQLAPADLLRHPELDAERYEQVLNAPIEPLYACRRHGHWVVIEGLAVLAKARKLGYETVAVKVVPVALLDRIAV